MLRHHVSNRKEAVTSQQSELEQLQARIRETEARLREKAAAVGIADAPGDDGHAQTKSKRGGLDGVFTPPAEAEKQSNGARRPHTGHGRKHSTSSGAKRK